ncbi:MAG: branched-chain-amino-acid transaminase [Deltaproteobacteria bacterium]|nr:branched-chain-amino-acid transaminase [Deltaproteobacteria bacterium]
MKAWVNGGFIDWDKVEVSILSHSFSRGSAIFEVLDIVSTEKGPAFFGLAEHVNRFFNTADLTFMDLPITKDELTSALIETAKKNNIGYGLAKFFAYYPLIEFTAIPTNPQIDIAIFCIDFDLFGVRQEAISAPVSVGVSRFRKLHPETIPIHAKVVGNYINPFLAKAEAIKKGYEDIIMVDTSGYVAEGATSNIFFIKESTIETPTLRNALPGITRKVAIEIIKDMGYLVKETDINPETLTTYDEAFYSGSLVKIQPIKSIEGKKLGETCPGPLTKTIMDKMKKVYEGKIKKYEKWLTWIK